jgi:hypothetical protein
MLYQKEMKGIISILLMLLCVSALAQDNDTAAIRKTHVKEMRLKQYVHAFDEKKDTCLLDVKKYNEAGKLIYSKRDLTCLGWNSSEEYTYTYKNGKMMEMLISRGGMPFAKNEYHYAKKSKDPKSTVSYILETGDTVYTRFKYFKTRKGRLDSTYAYEMNKDGSETLRRVIIRYNSKNHIVQVYTALEGDQALSMMSYERDKEGKMLGMAFTTYGEKQQFVQTYYEYNQNDAISKTTDTRNRTQLYFYTDKGLLNNVLTYNGKGGLEVEFLYEYEYYK